MSYPECAIVMQGQKLNEAEEYQRVERVERNMERFRQAEAYWQQKEGVR